jgi:branched-chain amino acid transport system permease protein
MPPEALMNNALCATDPGMGLVIQMVVLSLLGLSTWMVLYTGRISLGQQAYFGIGAYSAASLTTMGHWPLGSALLAGSLVGVAMALLMVWPLLRLKGLHFAVATLATAELVRLGLTAIRFQETDQAGKPVGPDGVEGFRDIRWLFDHQVGQAEYLALSLSLLIACLFGFFFLSKTRLGLVMNLTGQDASLALTQGVSVNSIRWMANGAAGGVAALAGGLYAHQLTYLEPAIFDPMLGVHAVGYAMLGGLATPLGPLLGAAVDLGLLEATRWFEGWRMVIFGGLVATLLRFKPRGLLDEKTLHQIRALIHRTSGRT